MKNDELTNHPIFSYYENRIEPILLKFFQKYYEEPEDSPDIEISDITDNFPLSDPGNERLILVKLDFFANSYNILPFEAMGELSVRAELLLKLNAPYSDPKSDHLITAEGIFTTNADAFILFTMLK